MSQAVACILMCQCGGRATNLREGGVFYVLTAERTIIFNGVCDTCHEGVRVEKPILDLIVHCPTGKNERVN